MTLPHPSENINASRGQWREQSSWWSRHQRQVLPYVFIAPNLLLFSAFMFAPLIYAFYISFFEWRGIGATNFVGLGNYRTLFTDPVFWQSLRHTFVYAAGVVPTSIGLGLATALLLNRRVPGRAFLRSVYFMPVVISAVATGVIAQWIFNDSYGVINVALRAFGLGTIPWLNSPTWALASVIIATAWIRIGFCMVLYLAGLQSIPGMYYDAAQVDGASRWQQFRHVTWPLLMPTTFLLLILNIIFSFESFDLVFVMTGGGPGYSTTVLPVYIYQSAFQTGRMGYGSAIGIVLLFIILIFTLVQWRLSRQNEL